MKLSEAQKELLFGGLCVVACGLLASIVGAALEDASNGRFGLDDDEPSDGMGSTGPTWRQHELEVVERMQNTHFDSIVLDNPRVDVGDQIMRPDVVVVDEYGDVTEVREAKAVQMLTRGHVRQAVKYDEALNPVFGTTIDVRTDTYVSDGVLAFAHARNIGVEVS